MKFLSQHSMVQVPQSPCTLQSLFVQYSNWYYALKIFRTLFEYYGASTVAKADTVTAVHILWDLLIEFWEDAMPVWKDFDMAASTCTNTKLSVSVPKSLESETEILNHTSMLAISTSELCQS